MLGSIENGQIVKNTEKAVILDKPNFVFVEDEMSDKIIYTIYGHKGCGKTTTAFLFKGKKYCISFDKKSSVIKNNYFDGRDDIKVYDGTKYLVETAEEYVQSSIVCYDYVNFLLDNIEAQKDCDYIIIDGLEILQKLAEMNMRGQYHLTPFQGVSNPNVWKLRTLLIRNIHNKALNCCKKGVIYTTYIDKDEVVEEGTIITKTDIPKWVDIVFYTTDVVLRVNNTSGKDGRKCTVDVVSSKTKDFKTGDKIDITNKKEW